MNLSSALLTDQYELTMIDAALNDGVAHKPCLFEVFARSLPGSRHYGVFCGTGRLLEYLKNFRFSEEDISFLVSRNIVSAKMITWLQKFQFSGSIWGYQEGEAYFPFSPVLTVQAPFAEGILLETLILSILNHDCAIATGASRMINAAHGRPLFEMGSRRTHEHSAVAAARAAYIAGFEATSNLEAGRIWDIPTMGTASHAYTLIHDTEREAFQAQLETMGSKTTLLIDTYDVFSAIDTAISLAGTSLYAVRLDSGDLPVLVSQVRKYLDQHGATSTHITVTSDLNEYTIAALSASPVDFMGVGTSLVTGSSFPTAGLVYKLVAYQTNQGWRSTTKRSPGKHHVGGPKTALRFYDKANIAHQETLVLGSAPNGTIELQSSDWNVKKLSVPLVSEGTIHGEHLGISALKTAREHHKHTIDTLPETAKSLAPAKTILPVVYQS